MRKSRRPVPDPSTSASLHAARRHAELTALADGTEVDVAVIGGGFTGTGVALEAAARGLSVALFERGDLAAGTSRFSSKLAHGGLRYLSKGQLGIAWESARERAALLGSIAPHLTRPLPMLFPLGEDISPTGGLVVEAGLRAGNALRALAGTRRQALPGPRRISAEEATKWVPGVRRDGLRGALLSWDGQLEDDARLVIGIARTAASYGARIISYATVTGCRPDGVSVVDGRSGDTVQIRARHVVNATGVWAGQLSEKVTLQPSKGSHLLVPAARLGNPRAALTVPIPGHFGRYVFAVPWDDGLVMLGLTDEPFDGDIPDEPQPSQDEETFLLNTVGAALDVALTAGDVVGRFAGFRPLLAGAADTSADLSRRHTIIEEPGSGMLTVVGGKLTTYRGMAQDVVDRIAARPGVHAGPAVTRTLPLVGAGRPGRGVPHRLARRFGAEAAVVAAPGAQHPQMLQPISSDIPVCPAEIRFAVDHELALTPADVLDRRTRIGLVPAWRDQMLDAIRDTAPELFDDQPKENP